MATLTVVSDLHLEGRPLSLDEVLDPNLVSDVLCLLGDIGDPSSAVYRQFLAACAARFPTVLLLAGNNEYRNHDGGGRSMTQMEELIRAAAAAHPNVHFLQNSTHVVGDVAFIGSTLWSYLPDTPLPPQPAEAEPPGPASVKGDGAAAAATAVPAVAAPGNAKPVYAEAALPPPAPAVAAQALEAADAAQRAVAASPGLPAGVEALPHDAVVQLTISEAAAVAAVAKRVDAAAVTAPAARQRPSAGALQQLLPQPAPVAHIPLTAALSPRAERSRFGLGGLPLPVPLSRRPMGPCFDAPSAGANGVAGIPAAAAMEAAARRLPAPSPRFRSTSMPPSDWLASQEYGMQYNPGSNGCGGAGCAGDCVPRGAGAGDGHRRIACPRRPLRHCVSLTKLRPDEPCPSWREIQIQARGGRRGGTSSESDARSSDSDSSQSSSDGSDVERSDDAASPYDSGDVVVPAGSSRLPEPPAAATASGGGHGAEPPGHAAGRDASRPGLKGSLASTAAATAAGGRGELTQALWWPLPAPLSPPPGLSQPTAGGFISTQAAEPQQQELSALPAFLSDPCAFLAASGGPEAPKAPLAITAAAAAAAAAAVDATADPPAANPGSGPAASSRPRHHHHHHHHGHQHHHRHQSHAPPPSTVREFIGATSLDFRRILVTPSGPPITPDDVNSMFLASLSYIRAAVTAAREAGLIPVVLTHHAPSMAGTSRPTFAGHPSTHSYSTDLELYLAGSGIAAWYCGHTHFNFDRVLEGGVRLASNQFGSQPKPAEGYSRAWQHRLPTGDGSSSSRAAVAGRLGQQQLGDAGIRKRAVAADEAPQAGAAYSQRGVAVFRSGPTSLDATVSLESAVPAPSSAWA
ncbi:hypothetical protein PLESTB_001679000 [Pleodorina starrii]|uniref:Calcineurin-like phosphoesterase domain-containing protein n=1 Tax=Pleodorina starrii TaxID=330485 RepID=A0A9W6BZ26_9CHLO|nr:hypothetical protein PLESTM_001058300 [Pleodorina starrii]GLC60814.1 hypothetical protein PLESTB_001679000 [Pleodorina starrii]GLC66738.1 hypothetical protein PLESTF_000466900 [Pleodorina starrii]